jgi:hypothetical protein
VLYVIRTGRKLSNYLYIYISFLSAVLFTHLPEQKGRHEQGVHDAELERLKQEAERKVLVPQLD